MEHTVKTVRSLSDYNSTVSVDVTAMRVYIHTKMAICLQLSLR